MFQHFHLAIRITSQSWGRRVSKPGVSVVRSRSSAPGGWQRPQCPQEHPARGPALGPPPLDGARAPLSSASSLVGQSLSSSPRFLSRVQRSHPHSERGATEIITSSYQGRNSANDLMGCREKGHPFNVFVKLLLEAYFARICFSKAMSSVQQLSHLKPYGLSPRTAIP